MAQIPVSPPPATHRGWDVQFSRIARHAGPRALRTLTTLARICHQRGHPVRIEHQLAESAVSTRLRVFDTAGKTVASLSFVLSDGWELHQAPEAHLAVELRRGDEGPPVPLPLSKSTLTWSADPTEVYLSAGAVTQAEHLQGPLLACL